MVGNNFEHSEVTQCLGRTAVYFLLLYFVMRCRARIADLSDTDLEEFLSMSVIKGGEHFSAKLRAEMCSI